MSMTEPLVKLGHVGSLDLDPSHYCWEIEWLWGRKYKREGLFCQCHVDILQWESTRCVAGKRGKKEKEKGRGVFSAFVCVCASLCVNACKYMGIYVCMWCVCACLNMCVCISVCIFECVWVCAPTYRCTSVCVYIRMCVSLFGRMENACEIVLNTVIPVRMQ